MSSDNGEFKRKSRAKRPRWIRKTLRFLEGGYKDRARFIKDEFASAEECFKYFLFCQVRKINKGGSACCSPGLSAKIEDYSVELEELEQKLPLPMPSHIRIPGLFDGINLRAWMSRNSRDCMRNFMNAQVKKFQAGKELCCSEGLARKIRRLALEEDLDL